MARMWLGLFILKILSLASSETETIGGLTFECRDGWKSKFGNCYRFVTVYAQQTNAANICKRYGSKLANPTDDSELYYLKVTAENLFKNESKFWIGYTKGEDNDCQGYWDNFQPNWLEGNCVAMKIDDGSYMVDKCFQPYYFVCQKEACVNDTYSCNNGNCIEKEWTCDGQNDCGDYSDETRCSNPECYDYQEGHIGAYIGGKVRNTNCILIIEAPIEWRITIELSNTQSDTEYLEILNGGSEEEISLIAQPYFSSTNKFYSKNNFVFVRYFITATEPFLLNWKTYPVKSKRLVATKNPLQLRSSKSGVLFPNLKLLWKIEAPKGSIITIKLSELILPNSEGNSFEIWYGDVMAVKLTYSTNNQVFISNTNEVYIYLNSGNEVCKGGFNFWYQEGCTIEMRSPSGQISSPGFNTLDPSSSLYVANTKCSWEITFAYALRFVSLYFTWFKLTDPNDFLQVYNRSIILKNLTGENTDSIHTTTDILRLDFKSSFMHVSSGFNATFSICSNSSSANATSDLCQEDEHCNYNDASFSCTKKTDYSCGKTMICRTVPCHGLESITDFLFCKYSFEDFRMFFNSHLSAEGATLSRYATFKTNDFSVCMKLLFSDQKNSEGTFITLFREHAPNAFEEYLSIGSKGITLNSKDYSYSVDLNTKDWSSFCVAISENGDTKMLVRKFKKTSIKISPLHLIDETFKIVIGRKFSGYITKLNIFNQLLTYDQFVKLPDPPYINWANYIPSWGATIKIPSLDPIMDICDFEVDVSKCPKKDKSLPQFSNCNTTNMNVVCPNLTCSVNITPPEVNKGSIKSTINPDGGVYNWGSKNVIFNAQDKAGNSAMCRFKLFVKYQTCENPPRFNQTNCNIVCPTGEALCMPFPLKLSCSKLGVFNRTHPFNDMLIPSCGTEKSSSVRIQISFHYTMSIVTCNTSTVLTYVTSKVKIITDEFISNYTTFCHGNCSTIQFNSECIATNDINMVIIIPYTTKTIKRNRDNIIVSTTMEVKRLVWLQNIYKKIEQQLLGTLVTDSINVTTFPECPFGYALVNNKCVQCGIGTYYDNVTVSCYYCPIGYYQNKSGQISCNECPNNTTTKAVGAGELNDCYENCSAGFYFDKKNCTPCAIGFYQNDNGQSFCKPCALGNTTYMNASDSSSLCFNICPPGYQLIGNGTCEICPRGYYRQFDYEPFCISCGMETTTETAGAISPDNCSIPACSKGEFLNISMCHDCPAGTYQDKIWQEFCIPCPKDTWTRKNGTRQNSACEKYCIAGYEKKNATDGCFKCPKGFFRLLQMLDPFALCTECPENFTTDGEGASTCPFRICPAGKFRNNVSNNCQDCLQGYYQPNITTGECLECPDNYTTLLPESKNKADCIFYCKSAGYEVGPSGNECIPCAKGFYKNATAGVEEKCSQCPQTFTTSLDKGATTLAACDLRICPAGKFRNNVSNNCQDCLQGYYQPNITTGECLECPDNYTTLLPESKNKADCIFYCKSAGYEVGPSGNECIPCAKGFYKNATAGIEEKCSQCPQTFTTSLDKGATTLAACDLRICPEGTFIDQTMCTPCANNTYQPKPSKFSCEPCPQDTYTVSEGSTKKSDCQLKCAAGYEGVENCSLCQINFFKQTYGAIPCSECPPFFIADDTKTVCNILNCPAGYYNATAASCLPCKKGKYKNSVGNSECTSCPNSAYTTNATGSTSVNNCTEVDCRPGYTFDNSTDTCIVCPKGTYQTKRGNYPCIPCAAIFTTFGNASTSEKDCLIPNCPTGEQPSEDYLSCTKCNFGYYKSEASSILCIKCPTNKTTLKIGATDASQCSKETAPDFTVLSTLDILIALQYTFLNCEINKVFYEEKIKTSVEKRIKIMSKKWNLCSGDCKMTVSINCSVSKRQKRATTIKSAVIKIGNVKADTDSKITNEITKTQNVFIQDCKINPDEYKVDSATLIGCVVDISCTYSKWVSKKCVKCPAGTKAILTGCADCPEGTYSAIDQRDCTNCTSPFISKPKSNSSSQCLAKCLVDPAYCKNGGICSRGSNDLYHNCLCPHKYSGDQCAMYYEPHDSKQMFIFVGIGCIAAILVIIMIAAVTIIYLRKQREKKKTHDSTVDDEPFTDSFYGFPMQGYRENNPLATKWKDIRRF